MGGFHIGLIHDGILHGGINLRVPEDFLNLLNGHSLINSTSGHSAPEFMRMDAIQTQSATQLTQTDFHTADL